MPTFEELSDLAQFVKPNKIKDLVIVGTTSNPTTKLDQLYHGLTHGHFADDAMAAEQVLGCSPRDAAYYKLKGRLYEKLVDAIFVIDIHESNFQEQQQAYFQCLRSLLAAKALISKGARKAAIPLAVKGLRKAVKYEFTDISLLFAKHLRTHFGSIVGDRKAFNKYNLLVQKHLAIHNAEIKAEEYYTELIINYVNSIETRPEVKIKARVYAQELQDQQHLYDTYYLNFVSYLVIILRFQIENDYQGIINACNQAILYFEKKQHLVSRTAIFHFSFKLTAAYLQTKKYKEAQKVANQTLELVDEGISNWYTALDYNILVGFHSQKYQQAYFYYQKAVNHPSFSQQYQYISERWKTLEAFIHFLIMKKLITPDNLDTGKKFRIKKFLNEVPSYSKDKRGNNITILILHILFLLEQEKYGEIIDRMESLKTYSHRYLRQNDTFRSNCFIKMLLQLPAASFHKTGVKRKAKKYLDKLLSVPLEKANQNADVEIIPYETLWEFVLDSLDNKFH